MFLWGAATAAFQIEGAASEDGKGESIWDRFSHTAGKVLNDDNGDMACDHYHRFKEDVAIMKEMGLDCYRFSISWPRVLPLGFGEINEKGLEFYDRLIELLVEANIKPILTLYHWDLPQHLQDLGGWQNPKTIDYFCEYARLIFERYREKVPYYITFNEVFTFTRMGYQWGKHAPGVSDLKTALEVTHNVLLAHGQAVKLFRALKIDSKISLAIDIYPRIGASFGDFRQAEIENAIGHFWVYDAIIYGRYPQVAQKHFEETGVMPKINDGDMQLISQKLDYFALNYYSTGVVKQGKTGVEYLPFTKRKSHCNWLIYPQGFFDLLVRIYRETKLPIIISENGICCNDKLQKGQVLDEMRVDYLREHIVAMQDAMQFGVDVFGYCHWSLLDNFEWAAGYSRRFGLIYVDYTTQQRIWKQSALEYKRIIAESKQKISN